MARDLDKPGAPLPSRRDLARGIAGALLAGVARASSSEDARPSGQIGYTEYHANLPGGRQANVVTMRACVVDLEGETRRRVLAEELAREPHSWTQFAGWSPDGRLAVIGRGWEDPENAAWEEQHKTFRFTQGWSYDMLLLDMATGAASNVMAVDRVSPYNSGLFFWPDDPKTLGFTALIDGDSHPFRMGLDGHGKLDLTESSKEFSYGFSASPDGRAISYHKNYQIYLADSDGGHARRIETGAPFNFGPQWSPDGNWLTFLSGEHYNCHPHLVRRDGTGLRKLCDRDGYKGTVEFLDVPDFHGGSSDIPAWVPDGKSLIYTAKAGPGVELMRVDLDGRSRALTHGPAGALNYHPTPSPDGEWIAFGSNRSGTRQLYVMRGDGRDPRPITQVEPGRGAMWPHWRPKPAGPTPRGRS